MKTDRELLELAAKAAGKDSSRWVDGFGLLQNGSGSIWNPLTDDGDALRLAVKLGIHIGPNPGNGCAIAYNAEHIAEEEYSEDKAAATRRAIVRAAAAIGESMP